MDPKDGDSNGDTDDLLMDLGASSVVQTQWNSLGINILQVRIQDSK